MTATISKEQAQAIEQKLKDLAEGENSVPKMREDLKALVEDVKAIDIEGLLERVDKMKAEQEKLSNQIANSKSGFYIPGVDDARKKFRLVKAIVGMRRGGNKRSFEDCGAGYEYEFLKSVFDAHEGELRKNYEFKAQRTDSDALGGAMVPDQVIPDVIPAIYARSAFVNLDGEGETRVTLMDGLFGNKVSIPQFEGGLVSYWVSEAEEATKSFVKTKAKSMEPHKLMILAQMTKEMQDMSGFGFEAMFRRDMVRSAALKLDWTIPYGTGAEMPMGIVNNPDIKIFSAQAYKAGVNDGVVANNAAAIAAANGGDWQGEELDFDGIDEMYGVLEDDEIELDGMGTISSPRFFRRLKKIKTQNFSGQNSGQPYLVGVPMVPDGRLAELIGSFGKTTKIPSNRKPGAAVSAPSATGVAKFTDVFAGNMNEIVVGRWAGISIGGFGVDYAKDITNIKLRMMASTIVRQPRSLIFCPDARARA